MLTATTDDAASQARSVGWRAFWNRGGLRRVLLLLVLVAGAEFAVLVSIPPSLFDRMDPVNPMETAQSALFGLVLPPSILAVLVVAFAVSVGWFPRLFGRQPIGGRRWMWVGPVLFATAAVAVLATNDYTLYSSRVVVVTVVSTLLVGFGEEVLCRGLIVELLRAGGHSEWDVMAISSLAFALIHSLHLGDGLSRQAIATTLFALPAGVVLYLTLRVTGNLIWPVLMHALYDSAAFLATGWSGEPGNARTEVAAIATIVAAGIIGLIFVRGRAKPAATPAPL